MKLRLTTKRRSFFPDVILPVVDDDGAVRSIPNRDAEKMAEAGIAQIECDVEMASIEQKQKYFSAITTVSKGKKAGAVSSETTIRYSAAVRKHCRTIRGLEDMGITTGDQLVNFKPAPGEDLHPVIGEIIQEVFLKATGAHVDDDDDGELSESE